MNLSSATAVPATRASTTPGIKTKRKYTKPTERRVGAKCPECGHPRSVSGIPKDPAKLAAMEARALKALAKVKAAQGITVVPVAASTAT